MGMYTYVLGSRGPAVGPSNSGQRVYLEQVEIVVQLVQLVNKELMNLLVLLVHRELLVLKVRLENQGQRGKDGRPEGILTMQLKTGPSVFNLLPWLYCVFRCRELRVHWCYGNKM